MRAEEEGRQLRATGRRSAAGPASEAGRRASAAGHLPVNRRQRVNAETLKGRQTCRAHRLHGLPLLFLLDEQLAVVLPLGAGHAPTRGAAVAKGGSLDAVALAKVAARHEVEDPADAGEAVDREVQDAG